MQSGYRKYHSTETTLIKLFNDMCALDQGNNTALILLDLSSAFDTVDHLILLDRLQTRFGITGNVLSLLRSFLFQRHSVVSLDGSLSDSCVEKWGVPHGSVLGPLLFNLYISPIEDIVRDYDFSVLLYADDTQLYISLKSSLKEETKVKLDACLSDIQVWFSVNKLTCNSNKTKFIFFQPQSRSRCPSSSFSISFGGSVLCPVDTALNLGVIWDKHLKMKSHISRVGFKYF